MMIRKERKIKTHLRNTVAALGILSMLTACNGIFDDIYDQPEPIVPAKGQLVIDATSWENWYYVDLAHLHQLTVDGDEAGLLKAQTEFTAYPIPMEATGDKVDAPSVNASSKAAASTSTSTQGEKPGQYMYWFDVFGAGYKSNKFVSYTPTAEQTAPVNWTFAVHRNNVRTNGAAVLETTYTSMDQLPETSEPFHNQKFTNDEWSENEVWDSQEQMLLGYVPSQGIAINKVLSSWLSMDIPPMPPAFSLNNHVFILRLKDGTYAALQLENYLSPKGAKCYLTINYKYPY